jgi:two-component system response regulator DegU
MIVEDNVKMRALIKQILMKYVPGLAAIQECEDGAEAVKQYAHFQPDWVLMDIQLQTLDGLAATQAITASHPQAKIIVVTNYDYPEYREAAKNAGACDYVLKENLLEIPKLMSLH